MLRMGPLFINQEESAAKAKATVSVSKDKLKLMNEKKILIVIKWETVVEVFRWLKKLIYCHLSLLYLCFALHI
jgi:hypothetical protein